MGNLLDGKVIIVTGGGPGVGRGIALAAARAGADVIVNDIGVGPGGEIEPASGPGQDVVNEIGAFGAGAAACTESVSTWPSAQKIIQAALDHFGRIDGVVNNTGILRDTIFHKLPPKISISWSTSISKVRSMSAAAAPHFKAQGSGSFVHMTSTSELIGNFGQVNYIAAKAGVAGISRAIALDMQRFGVTSNAIAPFAWTRMVNTIPADTPEARRRIEGLKLMDPNKIGPFVVALLSDEGRRRINGQIFVVRNNEIFFFSQSRPTHIAHTAEGCAAADHSRPRAADAGAAFSSRWGARVMSSPGRPADMAFDHETLTQLVCAARLRFVLQQDSRTLPTMGMEEAAA